MTVLITGARGTVAASLVRRLHDLDVEVRAATRAPDQLSAPAEVPVAALDLADPSAFGPALAGVTSVFLYAEPAGIDALLAAASAAGVERVVLLSSDSTVLPGAEANALAHHHLVVERALLAAPLASVLLRPGAFASNALGWSQAIRAGEPVEQAFLDARTTPIHPEDIVDVAELALTTDKLDGQAIRLGGPEALSFREQLAVLGELLGRRIEARELTREQAAKRMAEHMPEPIVTALLDYWTDALLNPPTPEHTAEPITGHRARAFAQWAGENLAAFR